MRLVVNLVQGFNYSVDVHQFPIDLEICTDVRTEVYSHVDVAAALLTRLGDTEAVLGYVSRATPGKRETVPLLPDEPLRMRIDVFEFTEDFEDYLPGSYCCDIKVEVGEKADEKMRWETLSGSVNVIVS